MQPMDRSTRRLFHVPTNTDRVRSDRFSCPGKQAPAQRIPTVSGKGKGILYAAAQVMYEHGGHYHKLFAGMRARSCGVSLRDIVLPGLAKRTLPLELEISRNPGIFGILIVLCYKYM